MEKVRKLRERFGNAQSALILKKKLAFSFGKP